MASLIPQETKDSILALKAQGLTTQQIALELGVSKSSVIKHLRVNGHGVWNKLTAEEKFTIRTLHHAGKTHQEIADSVGRPRVTILRWIARMGP